MLRVILAACALTLVAGCAVWDGVIDWFAIAPKAVDNAPDREAWARFAPWKHEAGNVHALGGGVEYIVLVSGPKDGAPPGARARVEIHYEGRLNSKPAAAFDSSFATRETVSFGVGDLIPGFSAALKQMRPGDSWLVFIPAAMGYGERGAGDGIPPNSDLVFEIEMKSATNPPPSDSAAWAKHVPWNSGGPLVKKTGSGLEYVVLETGPTSAVSPTRNDDAQVFYEGRLNAGGGAFDSAFARGETETFPVNAVVPGFSEALTLMKPGDRWLVFIPSKLGYGARGAPGAIPPNADLVFELLLVSVE
jgi:peptidylprolyl isomerase